MANKSEQQAPVIGPLYSHWGFKNWLLHLYPERIEAEPLGIGLSVKGGAMGGVGGQSAAQSVYAPDHNPSRPERRKSSETWLVARLVRIEVRRQIFTANEVRLYWDGGKKLVMAIGFRPATDPIRSTLRACYPGLYTERRFKAELPLGS